MQWITFHSGYDFGYLLKVLTYTPLPPTECEFFELLQVHLALYFWRIASAYDLIKQECRMNYLWLKMWPYSSVA